jgi:glycosyltransferase involved in cell wall biosynthesis
MSRTVLLVNSLYAPLSLGGAERSVRLLAEHLPALGWRPVVVTLNDGSLAEREHLCGVDIVRIPLGNLFWGFPSRKGAAAKALWHAADSWNEPMAHRVARIAESEGADVVHLNSLWGFSAAVVPAVRDSRRPVLATLRDYHLLCPSNTMPGGSPCTGACLRCLPYAISRRQGAAGLDGVVGISRAILDRHRRSIGWPDAVCSVIPNPHPDGAPPPRPATRTRAIGFLGRLSRMKGADILVEAFLAGASQAQTLVLAGEGDPDFVEGLRRRIDGDPRVRLLGWSRPEDLFRQIDWLAVPSVWEEPFGRVAAEALWAGVPVLASRSGGLGEIIKPESTGRLLPAGDTEAWSKALRALDDEDPARWSAACRAAAAAYAPGPIAARYADRYHALS